MRIILNNIGKKFKNEWIFRHLDFEFLFSQNCAIIGANGSGKSTLLNILSSRLTPDEGSITYELNGQALRIEDVFQHICICSSYIEFIEEYSLLENIRFHFSFKKPLDNFSESDIVKIIGIKNSENKIYHDFSSGMKQRVKLALAILSDVSFVLLDEPCTNLDAEGILWYQQMIEKYSGNKIIIVGSNEQKHEYSFCKSKLNLADYKN
ncbi:MAG TPA: ATP-binding cassette domain-containing protein [Bacteroidales bacterium]|nr:ATP-binding cassette domain-containing protein [Bacteroidales bacterium]HPS17127.1 ATP-binding cassette domain-containing protein [Bacteroidales bacterium]